MILGSEVAKRKELCWNSPWFCRFKAERSFAEDLRPTSPPRNVAWC